MLHSIVKRAFMQQVQCVQLMHMLQFNPVPKPEPGGPGGSMRTHALSIVETNAQTRHASQPVPYPMALALALARGGRVRVCKEMKSACDQLQKVYKDVLKEGKSPTSELALVVRCFFFLVVVSL